jgi:hypothetical protein
LFLMSLNLASAKTILLINPSNELS